MNAAKNLMLALFAVYQVAAVVDSVGDDPGPLASRLGGDWFWAARWQMFTGVERSVSRARFEVSDDGGTWRTLALEEALPAKWESGYRWERPAMWHNKGFRMIWESEACRVSGAKYSRVIRERRTKVLGQDTLAQTPTEELMESYPCQRK